MDIADLPLAAQYNSQLNSMDALELQIDKINFKWNDIDFSTEVEAYKAALKARAQTERERITQLVAELQ